MLVVIYNKHNIMEGMTDDVSGNIEYNIHYHILEDGTQGLLGSCGSKGACGSGIGTYPASSDYYITNKNACTWIFVNKSSGKDNKVINYGDILTIRSKNDDWLVTCDGNSCGPSAYVSVTAAKNNGPSNVFSGNAQYWKFESFDGAKTGPVNMKDKVRLINLYGKTSSLNTCWHYNCGGVYKKGYGVNTAKLNSTDYKGSTSRWRVEETQDDKNRDESMPAKEFKDNKQEYASESTKVMGGGSFSDQSKCQLYNHLGNYGDKKIIDGCNNDDKCEYVKEPGIGGELTSVGCQAKTMISFLKGKLHGKSKKDKIKAADSNSSFGNAGKSGLSEEELYLQKRISRQEPSSDKVASTSTVNSVSVGNGNNTIGTELKILLNPWLQSTLERLQPKTYNDLLKKAMVSIEQQLLQGVFMNDPGAPQPANAWGSCLQDNPTGDGSITLI